MKTLRAGDYVPDFTLSDQHGNAFNLKQHLGQKLVIYFYPKDESAVCTKEACAFRDRFSEFEDLGAMVVGINSGTVESHRAFAQKNNLPFTLLSDPDNKILTQFGIKPVLFLTGRETFLIDERGKIIYSYRAFLNGSTHPQHVLDHLKQQ